jgi:Flp pilus assembly protein TadG
MAAAVLTVIAVLTMFVVRLGVGAADRAKAQGAADAVALAGAAEGRSSAEALARRNGAILIDYAEVGDDVTVTVEVNGARGSARARHSAIVGRFEDLTDTSAASESTTTVVTGDTFIDGVLILRPPTTKPA